MTFHLAMNAFREPLELELPPGAEPWRRWIGAPRSAPGNIVERQQAPATPGSTCGIGAHCVVVPFATAD
jgi:hypothetical protein